MRMHAFSNDERWFAFVTEKGNLEAWDLESEKFYVLKKDHVLPVKSIKFYGNIIVSCTESYVHIWMPLENSQHIVQAYKDVYVIDEGKERLFLKVSINDDVGVYVLKGSAFSLMHQFRTTLKYFGYNE